MNEINYEVGFANVSWDNGYNNGIHFVNREPYELINTEFGITWLPSTKKINFIRRNQGQNAFLKIDTTDIIGIDFEQCFQFNYCIVKKVYKNAEGEITGSEYFYYFINDAHQSIQYKNCIEYILERDIIAQLKLNVDYTIPSVFTERNHQSRMLNGALNLDYNSPANHSDKIEKVSTNQKLVKKEDVFGKTFKVSLNSFKIDGTDQPTPTSDDYAEVEMGDVLVMFFTSIKLLTYKGYGGLGDSWVWDSKEYGLSFIAGSNGEQLEVPLMALAAPTSLRVKRIHYNGVDYVNGSGNSSIVSFTFAYLDSGNIVDVGYGWDGSYSASELMREFKYGIKGFKEMDGSLSTNNMARIFSYYTVEPSLLIDLLFHPGNASISASYNSVLGGTIQASARCIQYDAPNSYKAVPTTDQNVSWGSFTPENFYPVFELNNCTRILERDIDLSSYLSTIADGEPKMLKHPYTSMVLSQESANASFDYSILSSVDADGKIKIREVASLFPSGAEYSLFLNSGQYKQEETLSSEHYKNSNFILNIGATGKIKQSLPVLTNAYQEWLNNNSNAFISRVVIPTTTAAIGSIGMGYNENVGTTWAMDSKMSARYGRNQSKYTDKNAYAEFLANTGQYDATKITQTDYDKYTTMDGESLIGAMSGVAQYAAQMECLKATPDGISNMSTTSNLNIVGGKNRTLLSFYKITEREQETFKDIFFKVGYEVDKLMSSTEWFSRSKFNFIQINDNCQNKIVSSLRIGKVEKDLINDILNRGITLWDEDEFHNNKNFSYDLAGDNSEV